LNKYFDPYSYIAEKKMTTIFGFRLPDARYHLVYILQ
jgi:hypothetical protein